MCLRNTRCANVGAYNTACLLGLGIGLGLGLGLGLGSELRVVVRAKGRVRAGVRGRFKVGV